ncbi:MAG: Ig-like domain-containing protein [Bacteroidales bacterium]|nr:Ig-like domain-containing protein [Bacteroidales bacterium]
MSLLIGESATLVAIVEPSVADYEGIVWSSSDPTVATVENGVIQVHKVGTAVIQASAGGVFSNVCTVTVGPEEIPEIAADVTSEAVEETPGTVEATEDPEEVAEVPEVVAEAPEVTEEVKETATVAAESFIYQVDFGEKGSYIDIDSLIVVTDWRGRNFNEYPSYWGYYGPFEFTVDIENAECDLNGTRQALPESITLIQTEAGATSVKDPSSGGEVKLPANRHGLLMCRFCTVELTQGFNIYIKALVKYGFGTIQTDWITVPVVIGIPE